MMNKIFTILFLLVSFIGFAQEDEVEEVEDRYIIKNLSINNRYSNFGTSFYGEDKFIYASPAKRNYIINNTWKGNNQPFLDLYVATIQPNGDLKDSKKFSSKLNTKFHEAIVTFTKDKKSVYFTRSNYFNGKYKKDTLGQNLLKMFKASVGVNNEWYNIESMPFNDDNYSVGHPTLSEDQKTLYFISDMPGTLGRTDIFKVAVNSDGTYGNPINLGPEINTPSREMFPYIDGNDELYFSSDGREGLGRLDIFLAKIYPDKILEPIHLGNSINSTRDDFAFIINKEKREGYFSSNRVNGRGDDDIYHFKEEEQIIFEEPVIVECDQTINIIVKNKRTGEILPESNITISKEGEVLIDNVMVDENGAYLFEDAKCETTYLIEGTKKFYITAAKTFETSKIDKVNNEVILQLSPDEFIVVGDKVLIDLNTIYFDYDKYNIRRDAALELDKVVTIMKKYPDLIVEGGSHTDSRGRDAYNDLLSTRRAESTVNYVISKGIDTDRITAKGYGEKQLTNECSNGVKCTDLKHQLNRRTEFVIINPEVIRN